MTNKMTKYKEKALYHLKRKTGTRFILEINESFKTIDLIFNSTKFDTLKVFTDWEKCYNYLKEFTKTTKRAWIEDKIDCRLVIWDTDLEPEEQDCVDYLLEYFDYQQGSFEIEDLRDLLDENTDNKNMVNACDILIKALIKNDKEVIEVE